MRNFLASRLPDLRKEKAMINKIYRNVAEQMKGDVKYQPLFERIYYAAIFAMNCGKGNVIEFSGELYVLNYVKEKLKAYSTEPLVIFDVGANIGEYSLSVINVFKDSLRIFAFEPSKYTCKSLKQNLKAWGINNVEICNFGLGDINSQIFLYSGEKGSKVASIYKESLERWNFCENQEEIITIKTLDDFCDEKDINNIHFLKIDVEGHELKVLEGASRMLNSDKIQFIQFEFGPCNIDSRTYFRDFFYMLNDKYKIYRVVKNGIYPIEKYKEMYETFYVTNYLAEHR